MSKPENVKIPLSLLSQTIALPESWNVIEYDSAIQYDYDCVYYALLKKRQSLELRDAYAKIVFAENEDERHFAKMQYLQQKRIADNF